ncbi:FecR family protein [Pseudopedobacter beijingensis]|uniref:FecR family protein n=1 Tax=Pseudopedobacter beijingensis TaxID=1207056 RepID=A0ABW4IC58_9SPHI
MPVNNRITAELIKKYLNGECTLEEKATVIVWYNSFDKEQDVLEKLTSEEKHRLRNLMLNRINLRIDNNETMSDKRRVKPLYYWISSAAAIVLLVLGFMFYQDHTKNTIAGSNVSQIKEVKFLVLENQGNRLYQRELEDGTVIWLSPGAKVEIPERFAIDKREVKMTGKVFFEVAKNPERPFYIYGGGLTTKVLGTSFLINAEAGKDTEVSVVTGKVAVNVSEKEDQQVLLMPKQKAVFSVTEQSLKKAGIPEKSEVQIWKKSKLSFDNNAIKDVVEVLESNFNVDIAINKTVGDCVLKADFSDQNLPSILEMICKSVDASYEIKDGQIVITGKGCN